MATLLAVLRALGRLESLDGFLPEPEISPIQLAELKGKRRQRATGDRGRDSESPRKDGADDERWTWGDGE